jgi:CheY-like chemotaxis protein
MNGLDKVAHLSQGFPAAVAHVHASIPSRMTLKRFSRTFLATATHCKQSGITFASFPIQRRWQCSYLRHGQMPTMVAVHTTTDFQTHHALRVLIVDDNHDAADTLAVLLKLWGYDCQVSYDGASAQQMTRNYRPDCLLLDINMPGVDGCAVARRLRQEPELGNIKLVALAAYSDKTNTRRIQEAGFDHHVVKPADTDELQWLLTMMEQVLRLTSQTEELARKNVALSSETREILHGVK